LNPTLKIRSVTGVDLELEIAGPGARSYAFIIDWHIRLLAAVVWLFAGLWLFTNVQSSDALQGNAGFFYFVGLPSLAIYFLYHPLLEIAMQGRTPGKRIAGVRLVDRDGGMPGVGALLIRNVFRLVDALPLFYCVGLATVIVNKDSLRFGDIAAGTVLVYDAARTERLVETLSARAVERLGLKQAEVVRDLLGRWNELKPEVRSSLAVELLATLGASPPTADEVALRAALEGLLER
jgi:uncharacterized RDD family membrane protein YckC